MDNLEKSSSRLADNHTEARGVTYAGGRSCLKGSEHQTAKTQINNDFRKYLELSIHQDSSRINHSNSKSSFPELPISTVQTTSSKTASAAAKFNVSLLVLSLFLSLSLLPSLSPPLSHSQQLHVVSYISF